MTIRPFQAVYPNKDFIASNDSFFATVKEEYPAYKKAGFFQKTSKEAIYIYKIQTPDRNYTGLMACSDIKDYINGKIKKHELTLAEKEQKQVYLMMHRKAIVKPILLVYPRMKKIDELIKTFMSNHKPFYSLHFEEENQEHVFWEVSDGDSIEAIQKLFDKKIRETYIADGHHRCSASALLYHRAKKKKNPYENILSAFFPTDELEVHDYNRIVEGLSEMSLTTFMAKISQLFDIEILEEPTRPSRKHEIVMFLNKEWFLLKWKDHVLKKYKKEKILLDTSLLDREILKIIMGIKDVKTDTRIKYIEGPRGLEELKNKTLKTENRVAFCLYPAQMSDLLTTSDIGGVMPPKSTWFEPRMKNGIIVQEII